MYSIPPISRRHEGRGRMKIARFIADRRWSTVLRRKTKNDRRAREQQRAGTAERSCPLKRRSLVCHEREGAGSGGETPNRQSCCGGGGQRRLRMRRLEGGFSRAPRSLRPSICLFHCPSSRRRQFRSHFSPAHSCTVRCHRPDREYLRVRSMRNQAT